MAIEDRMAKFGFPGWETLYKERGIDGVAWHYAELDPDLVEELDESGVSGGKLLDLGTGSGLHALELFYRGFEVTGSDISHYVIEEAKKLSSQVRFVVDDILDSAFSNNEFDILFDRGCFHGLPPHNREPYLCSVNRILKNGGRFYLKIMRTPQSQPFIDFPYRFTEEEVEEIFSRYFEVKLVKPTIFYGRNLPSPPAWFVVLLKKG